MVEPYSSNFRVIRTNFLGVLIFRKFTVYRAPTYHRAWGPSYCCIITVTKFISTLAFVVSILNSFAVNLGLRNSAYFLFCLKMIFTGTISLNFSFLASHLKFQSSFITSPIEQTSCL